MHYHMSDHYYSKQPQSTEKTLLVSSTLRGNDFQFLTGAGVFSKKGVDFGSKRLIEAFQAPEVEGDFLDLGCGYGPIGISLARVHEERQVFMVDINERAIGLATQNAQRHNVSNVSILQSDGFEQVQNQRFAAVITNPPIRAGKKVTQAFFEESASHLVKDGELWLVVQKKQGAPSVITFLSTLFTEVEVIEKKKGYYIIRAAHQV